jgi:phosphatidylglycerol:prolipoprotein diacylglycerol transferase
MITYPQIDPVIFSIGPLAVRWYGMMYLLGFGGAYGWMNYLARRRQSPVSAEELSDMVYYGVFGVILGGRLGYVLFYNAAYYLDHPLQIFAVWQGGMSFHGGLIGVVAALLLFVHRRKKPVLEIGDLAAAAAPIGLFFGRLGNFINAELWGRTTDVPWAMVFPGAGPLPRHPSQLYEAFLEGVILFILLWLANSRKAARGTLMFLFFIGYGTARLLVEFVREPDAQIGFLAGHLTMGQLLSMPMILVGVLGLFWVQRQGSNHAEQR